ncbi:MAG: immunoglobulin domain-containing protein [Verrucomicrobiota bacterium]|nr:immunoglobulin domain-containing protein [Verrucomicrobiota bacterium]
MKANQVLSWVFVLGLLASGVLLHALEVTPYQEIVEYDLPTNAIVMEQWDYPTVPFSLGPGTPGLSASFQALPDNDVRNPPDTHGAVGLNHIVTMLNTEVRIQNRDGTTNYSTMSLNHFWTNGTGGVIFSSSAFDPRLIYDPFAHRWIATAVADAQSASSAILFAVSQTSDPLGAWYRIKLDVDDTNTRWADFPYLGFNKNWIVVSAVMLLNSGADAGIPKVWAFNRTNVFSGGTNHTVISPSANPYLVPALTYDREEETLYFLQHSSPASGTIRMSKMTGTPSSPVFTVTDIYPKTDPWRGTSGTSNLAPQTNTTQNLHVGDSRIQSVLMRNGTLWTTHTIFMPLASTGITPYSAVQWWQIDLDGRPLQVHRIGSQAMYCAYPSIAVNRHNDMLLGFAMFSSNMHPSAGYAFRAFTDPAGTLRPMGTLKAGEGAYWKTRVDTRNRWGDYSAACVDPINDADLWTIQEYSLPHVGDLVNNSGRWSTWWGKVSVQVPSNDHFTNALAISGFTGTNTNTTIRATLDTGEPNHLGFTNTPSIWYSWTAPTNGNVNFTTLISSAGYLDTTLAVYTGSSITNLTLVTSNDDGRVPLSSLTFNATSNTTYKIALSTKNWDGEVVLRWIQALTPEIVTQPVPSSVVVGQSITFSSTAIGLPAPTYQWRKNGVNISGATSSTYTINNAQAGHAGTYSVVASNFGGSNTSSNAYLTVYSTAAATLEAFNYTNNSFRFFNDGVTGYTYIIEASTNLTNWVAVSTNIAPFTFTNAVTTNFPYRFFRTKY